MSAPAPAPNEDTAPRERGSWLRRRRVELVASLAIAGGFAWLLHAGALPLVPPASAFARVRWWAVAVYFGLWCVIHVVRAGRWWLLIAPVRPVPLGRVTRVALIGFAAIVLLPFRTGEVVRPVLIRRRGHLSAWVATGTVAAERVIDGLCLSVLLFIALRLARPLDPLPDRIGELPVPVAVVPGAAYTALAVFAAAFLVMALFYWRRAWARRVSERVVGLVSERLARWLADRVEQVADGLGFLPRLRYAIPFVGLTLAYWLSNAAATWFLAWACGFDTMSFWQAAACVGVLALGILLPNAPGFFGAFQISVYAGFAMYFEPTLVTGPGAAFVFIVYLVQVAISLGFGAAALLVERESVSGALAATRSRLAPGAPEGGAG
ncbi:MAG: lysylphosphatidylglycerol synthase transmembrane domain-containing protein [Sorangiineae bacterium]|nr:lysylphosphatidylglycerol synthase transmembrane domain-containing protein [Polyangiaceae bacterium]MEB2321595.1 lysylphosphatidylglycerol synthase transmembrane domain-containing protein [Sorangiineae bacterium]